VKGRDKLAVSDLNPNTVPFIDPMMEAVSTSETTVNFYQTTRRNISEHTVLIIKAASTSEMSVSFYQTAKRSIPEDSHLQHNLT
jgi:predicted membrane-bound spermidine synthase